MDQIKEVREADIGVLEAEVNEIKVNTWMESIQLWAEDMIIDGFTLNQLYPDCVNELQGAYRDQTTAISMDIEAFSIDLCMLSRPSAIVNEHQVDFSDPTIDEMNPLGVTQVEYKPNVEAMTALLQDAADQYLLFEQEFERVEKEISEDIGQARVELVASLDSISSELLEQFEGEA